MSCCCHIEERPYRDYASTTETPVAIVTLVVVIAATFNVPVVGPERVAVDDDVVTGDGSRVNVSVIPDAAVAAVYLLAVYGDVAYVEPAVVLLERAADVLLEVILVTERILDRFDRVDTLPEIGLRVGLVGDFVTRLLLHRSDGCWDLERASFG